MPGACSPRCSATAPISARRLLAEPDLLRALLRDGPDATLERLLEELRVEPGVRRARLMAVLRQSKRRLALADRRSPTSPGSGRSSGSPMRSARFADLAVGLALELLLGEAAERGEVAPGRRTSRSPSAAS